MGPGGRVAVPDPRLDARRARRVRHTTARNLLADWRRRGVVEQRALA